MYKYKHKITGEVIETSNKVSSKNWVEIEAKQAKGGAETTSTDAAGKKAEGKKAEKEAENQ